MKPIATSQAAPSSNPASSRPVPTPLAVPAPLAKLLGEDGHTGSADRIVLALYRFLKPRARREQLHVFRELASADTGFSPDRVAIALPALEACALHLGHAPSRRQYDAFRDAQERPDEWPSATYIRNTFDKTWVRALDALGAVAAPDISAHRLLRHGVRYSPEARRLGLEMFAKAVPAGKRTVVAYTTFAREALKDPACPDIPKNANAYLNQKDGTTLADALVAAGFEDERKLRHFKYDSRVMTKGLSDEEICASLRREAAETGVRILRWTNHNAWAKANCTEENWILRGAAIVNRFGSWPEALHRAGLLTDDEAKLAHSGDGRGMTTEAALAFFAAATRDYGFPPPRSKYRAWRSAMLVHPDFKGSAVASDSLLRQRCEGGWTEMTKLAAEVPPTVGLPHLSPKDFR